MANEVSPRFTLYYTPTSYYSQKAELALYEKNEVFSERIVNTGAGEGTERWYMLINPAGLIPVLGDGDKFIAESEDIMDYIDKEIQREPQLVPSLDCDTGKEVAIFRKLLYANFPITYGIRYHPELSPVDFSSNFDKAGWDEHYHQTIARCQRLAKEHPELNEAYLKKADFLQKRLEVIKDRSRVQAAIDALLPVFDKVEEQLELVQTREDVKQETWLCGTTFTAADISLTALLSRIKRLGFESRFLDPEKRSALCDYWERVKRRPSFMKVQERVSLYQSSLKKH